VIVINEGKDFENQIKLSIEKAGYFYHRLKDAAQSFNPSQLSNLRFSSKNPYDCFLYAYPTLFALELKSTKQTSFSFWRQDFEDKTKSQTFLIHKHQIEGLKDASKYDGVIAGLILNFRSVNHTYFWRIDDFLKCTNALDKKSFNEADVINNNGCVINQTLKKVKYNYDIKQFVLEQQLNFN
jgi:penicillin-binding protein-related factor A (putative recombinase)